MITRIRDWFKRWRGAGTYTFEYVAMEVIRPGDSIRFTVRIGKIVDLDRQADEYHRKQTQWIEDDLFKLLG